MEVNWKYSIGEQVASLGHVEEMKLYVSKFSDDKKLTVRPILLWVEERQAVECIGGMQLFYTCRDANGAVFKYPESHLCPPTIMVEAWSKWFLK